MQAEMLPSRWRVVWAQVLAYFSTVVLTTVLVFFLELIFSAWISSSPYLWNRVRLPELMIWAIVLLFPGFTLAVLQRSALRKWLPGDRKWMVISGIAMPVLLLAEYWLLTRFMIFSTPAGNWYGGDFTHVYVVQNVVQRWSLIGGSVAGLAGGLIFGLIQAYFLPWHRRFWWLLSSIAWAVISGLILLVINALMILMYAL